MLSMDVCRLPIDEAKQATVQQFVDPEEYRERARQMQKDTDRLLEGLSPCLDPISPQQPALCPPPSAAEGGGVGISEIWHNKSVPNSVMVFYSPKRFFWHISVVPAPPEATRKQ